MNLLQKKRKEIGLSQRKMAKISGVSFRTVQLIESGAHDAKISTLQKIMVSLGYPSAMVERSISAIFSQPVDSIAMASERILTEGEASWKLWLFNFVDAFRKHKDVSYILIPPIQDISKRIRALMSSTVEALCEEMDIDIPRWCGAVEPLNEPWFVSGSENLKASALIESPVHFRKRNIFVLANFLSRR